MDLSPKAMDCVKRTWRACKNVKPTTECNRSCLSKFKEEFKSLHDVVCSNCNCGSCCFATPEHTSLKELLDCCLAWYATGMMEEPSLAWTFFDKFNPMIRSYCYLSFTNNLETEIAEFIQTNDSKDAIRLMIELSKM